MEYIIIKENKIDFQKIKNLENIEIPYIPIQINEMFTKDYEFMKKLIEYKRDGTLALLKIYDAINSYDDNFNLKIEKDIKNWDEFFQLIKNYKQIFTREGLNFYKNKETDQLNINFQIIDEKFLGSITNEIFMKIYHSYLNKFHYWPNPNSEQSDFINIELKNSIVIKKIKYYWHFKGVIFVKDINYGKLINGNFAKVELNGNPKLQIVCFDLNILEYLRSNEQNLKQYIDMIDDKIIAKNLKTLNIDFDF